jgi:hypothetical protein
MKDVSDKKALVLQSISRKLKQLANINLDGSPEWTSAIEESLSDMSTKKLEHFCYLLELARFCQVNIIDLR